MKLLNNILHMIKDVDGYTFERRTYAIGVWDMQANTRKDVTHDLGANYNKVVGVEVIIIDDNDVYWTFLDSVDNTGAIVNGGFYYIDNTKFALARNAAGAFNNASYNDGVKNRGFVYIWKRI